MISFEAIKTLLCSKNFKVENYVKKKIFRIILNKIQIGLLHKFVSQAIGCHVMGKISQEIQISNLKNYEKNK